MGKERPRRNGTTYEGPRYTVGVHTETDPCCYKDADEFDKLQEAELVAAEVSERLGRKPIVWDKEDMEIIKRFGLPEPQPNPTQKCRGRGRTSSKEKE
jgi:hypothetical protein